MTKKDIIEMTNTIDWLLRGHKNDAEKARVRNEKEHDEISAAYFAGKIWAYEHALVMIKDHINDLLKAGEK